MLDPAQKQRLMTLFAAGADKSAEQRAAFVAEACGDDPALQRELAELLEVDPASVEDFLAAPVLAEPVSAGEVADPARRPGESGGDGPPPELPHIDGYEQLEPIAEGGMGKVYKAWQLRPVRRTVALKVIKKGMDSDALLQRFEAERQAMALMSHPYIATVHDAGTDKQGRPFIAMEYVPGLPITDFCEHEQLPLDARLELLIKVCHAVEHAHRRGVLHRDLKPSNVLVDRRTDEIVPKVIDFGIAKAMQAPLGEHSIHTEQGSFLGTPEYMSPEQIDGAAHHIDTRTDVYALGVILYELLTLSRPFDSTELRQAGFSQLQRIVRDQVPQKPSTRLRERLATDLEAARRGRDTTQWQRRLSGDLDWITMKALEKEPDRRYASARDLSLDLENFLRHRPVTAGPPSGWYRVRKFVRRYRVQVIAAALVVLSMAGGLFGTTWFLVEANARSGESELARRNAEGIRLATEAMLQAEENPGLALLLALEASKLTDNYAVRQAIHQTLPQHRELRVLDGHDYSSTQVLMHPDGRRLVSLAAEPAPLLWDVGSGALLRRFVGHTDLTTRIDLDPTGQRLLTTSLDGTARVWDVDTGETLYELREHGGPVDFGAFSPDGSRIATAARDKTARIYDAGSGRTLHVLTGHEQLVSCLAFDTAGRHLVTRSFDQTCRIWSVETGALERRWTLGSVPFHGLRANGSLQDEQQVWFQPGGDRIVTRTWPHGGRAEVRVDALDRDLEWLLPDGRTPVFVDHGRRLMLTRDCKERRQLGLPDVLTYVDLQTGEISEHPLAAPFQCGALSPDERHAVSVAGNRIEVVDREREHSLGFCRGHRFEGVDHSVTFHPDGTRFATTSHGGRVRIWEVLPEYGPRRLSGGHSKAVADLGGDRHCLAATAAGTLAVVGNGGGPHPTWSVWNADTMQQLCTIDDPTVKSVQISPDGTMVFGLPTRGSATSSPGDRILVFDTRGRRLREIVPRVPFRRISVRPDGRQLVVKERADAHAVIGFAFYDLQTGERVRHVPARERGQYVGWGAEPYDRVTSVYHDELQTDVIAVATGEVLASVKGPGDEMHLAAALSPDGRYLMVALADLRAQIFDLASGSPPSSAAPAAEYTDLVPMPSLCGFCAGGQLAWVACNKEVHIFATATADPFSILRLDAEIRGVCVSANGEDLITLTIQGDCQRWPLDPIGVARRRAQGQLEPRELAKYHIGTASDRLRRERELYLARPHPQNWESLARLELQQGNRDAAIACYQEACDLGPHAPKDVRLYVRLAELLCQRLADGAGSPAQQAADRDHAIAALGHALRCKATADQLLALPGIEHLAADPRFTKLLGK